MSQPNDESPTELHLFAGSQSVEHVELLTVIAHYNRTGSRINCGDSVNFGRPWIKGATSNFGLISRPYLDGPNLETLKDPDIGRLIHCLWLVPITQTEVEYKKLHGTAALEQKLEEAGFNYLDAHRQSVI
jgi:hypothetical protein